MVNKIIIFEKLNLINLFISFFYLPNNRVLYYRYTNLSFIKSNFFKKYYFCIGLCGQGGSFVTKAFHLKKYLVRKFIKRNINKKFFEYFCILIKLSHQKIKKLEFALENYFYDNQILVVDASSYVLATKLFKNHKILYFTDSLKSYLVLNEIDNKFFYLSKLFLISYYFNIIFNILKKITLRLNFFKIKKNPKLSKNILNNNKNNQIAYFPHQNLYYGNFFSKTFMFDREKQSPLYKDKIDIVFFQETDELSNKFLNINKINKVIILQKTKILFKDLKCFLNFFFNYYKLIKKYKISIFLIFLKFYLEIKKFNLFLNHKNYKFLIFYNEYQIPNSLLLSAEVNNIKTISFQDRLTSHIYYNRVFFDYYLTSGQFFSKKFMFTYFINKIENIGLLRSNLIDIHKTRHENFKNKIGLLHLKNIKVITFLFSTERSTLNTNLYGEDGTSIKSNLEFVETLVRLSDILNDVFFLVKFKDKNFIKFNCFKKLNNETNKRNNIEIIKDERISSGNLISLSDIVVGKQSTIMEESLLKKKYAFIYDTENFVSSFGFYRKK